MTHRNDGAASSPRVDLERLNALVDGELSPPERAAVAAEIAGSPDMARAYATLAHLKATVGSLGGDSAPVRLRLQTPLRRRWPAIAAAALLAVGLAAAAWLARPDAGLMPIASPRQPTMVSLPALPPGVTVPSLDKAGLKLVAIKVEPPDHVVFAIYLGPHGCKLELRAAPRSANLAALTGSRSQQWTVGDTTYDLVAHGMPATRFALIANASEWQTRQGLDPRRIEQLLHEASLNPPPCIG